MFLKTLLDQASSIRFKLLALVGENKESKGKIINSLKENGWTSVDVESELLDLKKSLNNSIKNDDYQISEKIKEWFSSKPDNLILLNSSILYHDIFLKISPVGAFKYNSRSKNCVIFLEKEHRLGQRIYHGEVGKEDYYDQEINDIVIENINNIDDFSIEKKSKVIQNKEDLDENAIGRLFDFNIIKDVIDIDTDLKEISQKRDIVSSYVISDSLQRQLVEFFENLANPKHKANTVIGNYGSGKSHLIAFLVSLVENPELKEFVKNDAVKNAAKQLERKFFTVQFELQGGQTPLRKWFYGLITRQLKEKYNIDIPPFDLVGEDFDDKENIKKLVHLVKKENPENGLLVIVDEISDFLSSKPMEEMKSDLQFLRVIGQMCQEVDIMFVGSMQEDVFSSYKFRNVAQEIGRIGERFQNIIIHKDDVEKVIANRIVPKTNAQRHSIEKEMKPFSEKIDQIAKDIDQYVTLFPLTPFLLDMFTELPYFEKRGVIQFAQSELKYILNEKFPCFITFEKVYDLLENNPNKRNLEEVSEVSKVVQKLMQKIKQIDEKYKFDAIKIVKGLAVYSLWDKKGKGATAIELANNLLLLPQSQKLGAADNIKLIIKKIREVTDGEYIKVHKDDLQNTEYFIFDLKGGVDVEEKIAQKCSGVSNPELEEELFRQIKDTIELEPVISGGEVFYDECQWPSVKSYRKGKIVFIKKDAKIPVLEEKDYVIVFISPFVEKFDKKLSDIQIDIKFHIGDEQNVELLREIVAIKSLIDSNFQKHVMVKKLEERINGYQRGGTNIIGFKHRLSKLLIHRSECSLNGNKVSITSILPKEGNSFLENIEELKKSLLDKPFLEKYPAHPVYAISMSASNHLSNLNPIVENLTKGDFNSLSATRTLPFLQNLKLVNSEKYPDTSESKIALWILDVLKKNKTKVTDIEQEIVIPLQKSEYGLEREMTCFYLVFLAMLGKIYLQAKGGDKIDINNIQDKVKSLAVFENIAYAKMQENISYDFAARLMNVLGLNGNKIAIEKERQNAFREYKEKLSSIFSDLREIEAVFSGLKKKTVIYINTTALSDKIAKIKDIEWNKLDISNHTQFGSIEYYNDKIHAIKIALEEIKELSEALKEYDKRIHSDIEYMIKAVEMIEKNPIIQTDAAKFKTLKEYLNDVKAICLDAERFLVRAERNPVKGKIDQFRKIYVYDIYIPAHEKYVGTKVDWKALDNYQNLESFKKVNQFKNITCITGSAIERKVVEWMELKKHRCTTKDLGDKLNISPFCSDCMFPRLDGRYSEIPGKLANIETEIESLAESNEKTVLKEIREYRDNLQFLDKDEKEKIEAILKKEKLPPTMTPELQKAINKLFKEIKVVDISVQDIIKTLFPDDEMITIEELKKRFFSLESELTKGKKESEIRIKLK